jgi:hypothetical protein
VNTPKSRIEDSFITLLQHLTPKPQYTELFKAIVLDVWKDQQAAAIKIRQDLGQSISEKSYQDARRVLDEGLQALGAIEVFRRIDDISLKHTSKAFQQGQSANPDASYDVGEEQGLRVIDLRGARSYRESKIYRGGSSYWGRQVAKNNLLYRATHGRRAGDERICQ